MRKHRALVLGLKKVVGAANVILSERRAQRYTRGFRFGGGAVAAVVRPGSLVELWRTVNLVVTSGCAMIVQAANTGLTGGSTPWGGDYDRDIILINVMRINGIHLLGAGEEVVCLPGAELDSLERILQPLGREPHSVIGSSCIGASVIGGICNSSGGSLVQRGPAYTELSLYAEIRNDGTVELVNNLGVELGGDPEEILARVEQGDLRPLDVHGPWASDREYAEHVRQVDAPTPARYNADPRRLKAASGCAGKLVVFAVRLDTFPAETATETFYIGTNESAELGEIRRHILSNFRNLPISGEYIHCDAYDIAARYGKDTYLIIRRFGTSSIPSLFALKSRIDSFLERVGLGTSASDRMLQRIADFLPTHLPKKMSMFRERYSHHLLLKMGGDGIQEARTYLRSRFPSKSGDFFECNPDEAKAAFLHRFAVAGAAGRYRAVHHDEVEDILALDIALPRNLQDWTEDLPEDIENAFVAKLYYGHFFCHVFHQDYIVRRGLDCAKLKDRMLQILDERGAEYPAEHNVGHLYAAKPSLAGFYKSLDPTNTMNPGIGQTSRKHYWK